MIVINKEEERNYVFAQLSSLPNAFQYVSVTNYIENLERENKKYKEVIEKAIEYLDDWLFNVGGMGACMEYEDIIEILEILKGVE